MATMNISLPDQMKEWVEERVAQSGRYANVSDYMRDLIRAEQDRRASALEWLEREIQKGIDSGPPIEVDLRTLVKDTLDRIDAGKKTAAE